MHIRLMVHMTLYIFLIGGASDQAPLHQARAGPHLSTTCEKKIKSNPLLHVQNVHELMLRNSKYAPFFCFRGLKEKPNVPIVRAPSAASSFLRTGSSCCPHPSLATHTKWSVMFCRMAAASKFLSLKHYSI